MPFICHIAAPLYRSKTLFKPHHLLGGKINFKPHFGVPHGIRNANYAGFLLISQI